MSDSERGGARGSVPEDSRRVVADRSEAGDRGPSGIRSDGGTVSETAPAGSAGSGIPDEVPDAIAPETVFEVLSNERRRYVLHHLRAADERVTVRELSEQVAAWENEVDRDAVTAKERKRVYTALHQTHLPKMAKVGVIDYDRDRGTLELTEAVEAFDIYLEIVPERDLSWSDLYLALGIISTTLVTVVWLGVYPFFLLPDIAYGAAIAVTWLVVSAVHTYARRSELVGSGDPGELSSSLHPPK